MKSRCRREEEGKVGKSEKRSEVKWKQKASAITRAAHY